MSVLGYIRVSTDSQDIEKQRYVLLEYAQKQKLLINEFVEVEVSAQKSQAKRKIDVLFSKLQKDDVLVVTEVSRLGRNMLETLNIISKLSDRGVKIHFVRQPELSTDGPQSKFLLVIYSYFAEMERDYISLRTKEGLAAVKASGKKLGRPKGSKNKKSRRLDPYKDQIEEYLQLKLPKKSVMKIINSQLDEPVSYTAFRYYIDNDRLLKDIAAKKSKS